VPLRVHSYPVNHRRLALHRHHHCSFHRLPHLLLRRWLLTIIITLNRILLHQSSPLHSIHNLNNHLLLHLLQSVIIIIIIIIIIVIISRSSNQNHHNHHSFHFIHLSALLIHLLPMEVPVDHLHYNNRRGTINIINTTINYNSSSHSNHNHNNNYIQRRT